MIRTTVADLQSALRDMPPEMPIDYQPVKVDHLPPPPDLGALLSVVHAHLFRANSVLQNLLDELRVNYFDTVVGSDITHWRANE
jgi:hypothetical protein